MIQQPQPFFLEKQLETSLAERSERGPVLFSNVRRLVCLSVSMA